MSLADVKEVRRIITNMLADSVKSFSVISVYHNRSRAQFSAHISYGCCNEKAKEIVNSNPMITELLELQTALHNKQIELARSLKIKAETGENNYGRRSTIPDDHYSIIASAVAILERQLQQNVQDAANMLAKTYSNYLDSLDTRTFDAYTKGMSADDFLNIIKDEIAEIKTKAEDLKKEIEKNGYNPDNK